MKSIAQPPKTDRNEPDTNMGRIAAGRAPEEKTAPAPSARRRRACIVVSWAAVAVMAAVIFWMSSRDGITLDENSGIVSAVKAWLADAALVVLGRPVDVSPVGHFTEYLVFGATLANALRWHLQPRGAMLAAIASASAYGVTDEIHQIFVPMRSCDPADWAVDTFAAAIGAVIALAALRLRSTRPKP